MHPKLIYISIDPEVSIFLANGKLQNKMFIVRVLSNQNKLLGSLDLIQRIKKKSKGKSKKCSLDQDAWMECHYRTLL